VTRAVYWANFADGSAAANLVSENEIGVDGRERHVRRNERDRNNSAPAMGTLSFPSKFRKAPFEGS
jgi:hypothetical protein